MRKHVLRLAFAAVIVTWALPAVAGDRVYNPRKNRPDPGDTAIYHLAVPWPFGDREQRAEAAVVAAEPQPEERTEETQKKAVTFGTSTIYFSFDSSEIRTESRPTLDAVGRLFDDWPNLILEIGGHCDNSGPGEYNLWLSQQRANAVMSYLLTEFPNVRPDALSAVGYGEDHPVESNASAEGRAKNRRVELRILNSGELTRN